MNTSKVIIAEEYIEVMDYKRRGSVFHEKTEHVGQSGPYEKTGNTANAAIQVPGLRIPSGCTTRKEDTDGP